MKDNGFDFRAAHNLFVSRLLSGPGQAPDSLRRAAFSNSEVGEPVRLLVEKVASAPTTISDKDFATAIDAGFNEDQIFELVICAAVGQASREYQMGLLALDEATTTEDPEHAT